MDLVKHLVNTLWIPELEHALERFSIRIYLDWRDEHYLKAYDQFPEKFLNYLEGKGKSGLYHQHCLCYLEHVMSSIDRPPSREKFRLIRTLKFILDEPFTSFCEGITWKFFCATLFKLNSEEFKMFQGGRYYSNLFDPFKYDWDDRLSIDAKSFVPEPILSHQLANVAISCMQYLHRWDSNTPPTRDHFLASWATKSKQSPWLWRRRMRLTSMARRQRIWNLRLSNQKQRICYTWALDLLYHTLRKALKSDELTRALSRPFIPSHAPLLFPRRVKRVRKAAAAYLKKFSPSSLDASSVEARVRRSMRGLPHINMIAIDDDNPESSRRIFLTGRDATKKDLKRNIDHMLDAIFCPTGSDPKILESVGAAFDLVNKLGTEIATRQLEATS